MRKPLTKILAFLLSFLLCFEQSGFAQSIVALDIAGRLASMHSSLTVDKFRPLHLRYLQFDPTQNNFNLLIDKGTSKNPSKSELEGTSKDLMKYFFVGLALPNDKFWVNLRPDSPDNMIDPLLGETDVGRIFLESDLELKKDTARATSLETSEGKLYWDKLYQKAAEIFGLENITIPTLTRPWIVPDEIIIRETQDSAYIHKATLKVMLEQDYLKNDAAYRFDDPRMKALNEYSSQLIRELIIPKLTKEINSSKKYAPLRQVYYSLILARWFKERFAYKQTSYSKLIESRNLYGLTADTQFSQDAYFQAYRKSFKDGEYNVQAPVYTPYGQAIRSYFSGGITGLAPQVMPVFGGSQITDPSTGARITSSPAQERTPPQLKSNAGAIATFSPDQPEAIIVSSPVGPVTPGAESSSPAGRMTSKFLSVLGRPWRWRQVVSMERPIVYVRAEGIVAEDGIVVADNRLTQRLRQAGITALIGEGLNGNNFITELTEFIGSDSDLVKFFEQRRVVAIRIPQNIVISPVQRREAQEVFNSILEALDPQTAEEAMPLFVDFISKMSRERDLMGNTQASILSRDISNMNRVLRMGPDYGFSGRLPPAYLWLSVIAQWNYITNEILGDVDGDMKAIEPLMRKPFIQSLRFLGGVDGLQRVFNKVLVDWRKFGDKRNAHLFLTMFLNTTSSDKNIQWDSFLTLSQIMKEHSLIAFDGRDYRIESMVERESDTEQGGGIGKSPIFEMRLVNSQGGQKRVLVKWAEKKNINNDIIGTKIARKLNVPAYHVEMVDSNATSNNESAWVMIEYRDHVLVAYSFEDDFLTPGMSRLLSGTDESIKDRLLSLGAAVAVSYILDSRDADMKHFLLADDKFIRIDQEYMFGDVSDSKVTSVVEADVGKLLAIIQREERGDEYIAAFREGFDQTIEVARTRETGVLNILREHVPAAGFNTIVEGVLQRLNHGMNGDELIKSYASVTSSPVGPEMPGKAPSSPAKLNNRRMAIQQIRRDSSGRFTNEEDDDRVAVVVQENGLIGNDFIRYWAALRKIVNPNSQDITIAVGASGSSIASVWIATHFKKAYFIDYGFGYQDLSLAEFERFHNEWSLPNARSGYFVRQHDSGWVPADEIKNPPIAFWAMQELRAMGVEKGDIKLDADSKNRPRIRFKLPGEKNFREIIIVEQKLPEENTILNEELHGQVDVYLEKASQDLPLSYNARFFGYIKDWLKPGGFILINGFKNGATPRIGQVSSADRFLKGNFRRIRMNGITRMENDIYKKIAFFNNKAGKYGWQLSVWQSPNGNVASSPVGSAMHGAAVGLPVGIQGEGVTLRDPESSSPVGEDKEAALEFSKQRIQRIQRIMRRQQEMLKDIPLVSGMQEFLPGTVRASDMVNLRDQDKQWAVDLNKRIPVAMGDEWGDPSVSPVARGLVEGPARELVDKINGSGFGWVTFWSNAYGPYLNGVAWVGVDHQEVYFTPITENNYFRYEKLDASVFSSAVDMKSGINGSVNSPTESKNSSPSREKIELVLNQSGVGLKWRKGISKQPPVAKALKPVHGSITQDSPFYSLLSYEENLVKLLTFLSILRTAYPNDTNTKSELTPLQYALRNGIYFKVDPDSNIFVAPTTESFRRFILFTMDADGRPIKSIEIKIPGEREEDNKKIVNEENFTISKILREAYPNEEICPIPIAFISLTRESLDMYGRQIKFADASPSVMVYSYNSDGKRLKSYFEALQVKARGSFEFQNMVAALNKEYCMRVAQVHALGILMNDDMHSENARVFQDEVGNYHVMLVGDFEDLVRLPPNTFAVHFRSELFKFYGHDLYSLYPYRIGLINEQDIPAIADDTIRAYEEVFEKFAAEEIKAEIRKSNSYMYGEIFPALFVSSSTRRGEWVGSPFYDDEEIYPSTGIRPPQDGGLAGASSPAGRVIFSDNLDSRQIEELKKGGRLVRGYDNNLIVRIDPLQWPIFDSSFATIDKGFYGILGGNLSDKIAELAKSKPDQTVYVLDWGAGNLKAVRELSDKLESQGIGNVNIIAYADEYPKDLGPLPSNVLFIVDIADNLKEQIKKNIPPGQQIDVVYSWEALHFLLWIGGEDRFLKHLQDISGLVSDTGFIVSNVTAQDRISIYEALLPRIKKFISRKADFIRTGDISAVLSLGDKDNLVQQSLQKGQIGNPNTQTSESFEQYASGQFEKFEKSGNSTGLAMTTNHKTSMGIPIHKFDITNSGSRDTVFAPENDREIFYHTNDAGFSVWANIDVGIFAFMELEAGQTGAFYSKEHYNCQSFSVMARRNGRVVIGYAHILADTRFPTAYVQYQTLLRYLTQGNGFSDVKIILGIDEQLVGFPRGTTVKSLEEEARRSNITVIPSVSYKNEKLGAKTDVFVTSNQVVFRRGLDKPPFEFDARYWNNAAGPIGSTTESKTPRAAASSFVQDSIRARTLKENARHFDRFGVAITEEGRKIALDLYQEAVNRFIASVRQLKEVDGAKVDIDVVALGGSLSQGGGRLGVFPGNITFEEASEAMINEKVFVEKGGVLGLDPRLLPSDLDIEINYSGNIPLAESWKIDVAVKEQCSRKIYDELGIYIQSGHFIRLNPSVAVRQIENNGLKELFLRQEALLRNTGGDNKYPVSSPAVSAEERIGGIDFRNLPVVTQAIGNLSMSMGRSSLSELSNINLDKEWSDIERMVSSGITPSTQRIKEYVRASSVKGDIDTGKVISCISEVLRQEEESCCRTDDTLRDILVVLESSRSSAELKEVFVGG